MSAPPNKWKLPQSVVYTCSWGPPPAPSEACNIWLAKIANGWRPNKRIRQMGYELASEFFGVYIWEYCNVISPALQKARKQDELQRGRQVGA